MGRARSNLKRRPKGKRGWRKIDIDSYIKSSDDISTEDHQKIIESSKDSQLWSQDITPRIKKKLTKKQKKEKARKKLLSAGFSIDSIKENNNLNKQIKQYKDKQRLLKFKNKDKDYSNSLPKSTQIIKFKNKNKIKIKLNNHQNIIQNKKNMKNMIDYNRNNNYHLYKLSHSKQNKSNKYVDLWQHDIVKPKKKVKDDDLSNFRDIKPLPIIRKTLRASKGHKTGHKTMPNKFIINNLGLSIPNSGESINPLLYKYYYLKWKSYKLRAQQLFKHEYQYKSTYLLLLFCLECDNLYK